MTKRGRFLSLSQNDNPVIRTNVTMFRVILAWIWIRSKKVKKERCIIEIWIEIRQGDTREKEREKKKKNALFVQQTSRAREWSKKNA